MEKRRLRRREFLCDACSYRAIAVTAPEQCPMCGNSTWMLVTPQHRHHAP